MKRLGLLFVAIFISSITAAYAVESETYRAVSPDSDETQALEQDPTEATEPGDDASETAETSAKEEAVSAKEEAEEREVFIPKKVRHVWNDEKTVTGENGSSTTTTSNTLTDKLNKISGGGSTES